MRFTCLYGYVPVLSTFLVGVAVCVEVDGVSTGSDPYISHGCEFDHGSLKTITRLAIFTSRTASHSSFVISGTDVVGAAAAACCTSERAGDGGDT